MLPSSIMTFRSLTQAPSTFLRVLVARAMPCWMASSKLLSETALISVTVATLISSLESPLFRMLAHYYCLHVCLPTSERGQTYRRYVYIEGTNSSTSSAQLRRIPLELGEPAKDLSV